MDLVVGWVLSWVVFSLFWALACGAFDRWITRALPAVWRVLKSVVAESVGRKPYLGLEIAPAHIARFETLVVGGGSAALDGGDERLDTRTPETPTDVDVLRAGGADGSPSGSLGFVDE